MWIGGGQGCFRPHVQRGQTHTLGGPLLPFRPLAGISAVRIKAPVLWLPRGSCLKTDSLVTSEGSCSPLWPWLRWPFGPQSWEARPGCPAPCQPQPPQPESLPVILSFFLETSICLLPEYQSGRWRGQSQPGPEPSGKPEVHFPPSSRAQSPVVCTWNSWGSVVAVVTCDS